MYPTLLAQQRAILSTHDHLGSRADILCRLVSFELIHETQTTPCYGYNFAPVCSGSTKACRQQKGQLACPGVQGADREGASAVNDPSNLTPGCGNHGCAGGVCGREVLPPLNAEVALLFLLGVSPKTPRKLFRRPSTLLLCTAVASVMTTMITI